MSCCTSCTPAFCNALQSKFKETSTRDRLCKITDYVGYLRLLVETDIANGLDTPSTKTMEAAQDLIEDLDALLQLFKGPAGPTGVQGTENVGANDAQNWGLKLTVNCRLVTILIKQCYASNDDTNFTLGHLANQDANYDAATDKSYIEFLCCLCDNFKVFIDFLNAYVK